MYYLLQQHGSHLVAMEAAAEAQQQQRGGDGLMLQTQEQQDVAVQAGLRRRPQGGRAAVLLAGTAMLRALQVN